MKKFIVLIISLSLASCVLTKKQQTRFLAKHCVGKDSIVVKDTTILKDTTIYLTTQGPIQYLPNPCKELCDSLGNLRPYHKEEKKNGIKSTISTIGNVLAFNCEADSLKAVITTLRHERSTYKKTTKIVKVDCEKEHIGGWDYFWIKSSYILWSILILYIALKCFKTYLTSVFPMLGKFL